MRLTTTVSVIIVNYNTGQYAKRCVDSLLEQQGVSLQIVVVDNASQDNSIELLKSAYGERITLIASEENLGFGRANNLGAQQTHGDYLLLLNPDTVLKEATVIARLVSRLKETSGCGMLGPAIFEPRKNKVVKPRMSYPCQKQLRHTEKLKSLPGDIAWLLGACLLIPAALYRQIHGFDPDFFLYGEDVDISLRVREAGYALGYAPDIVIEHVAGASEALSVPYEKWLRKKRGYYLFCVKHYAREDMLGIARKTLSEIHLRLFFLRIAEVLRLRKSAVVTERKNRLYATRDALKEAIARYH